MKNKLTKFMFIAMLVFCLSVAPSQALIITLDVQDPYIRVGESFDVVVSAFDDTNNLGDLTAFGFDVDPLGSLTLISFDSATVDNEFVDVSLGVNNVAGFYTGLGNAGMDVTLAMLSFTALAPGTDTLEIEGLFNGFDMGLYYVFSDEDIVASTDINVNPVPEPATMMLLTTGLIGVAAFRRKLRRLN